MGGLERKIFNFLAPLKGTSSRLEYNGRPLLDYCGNPAFTHPRTYYELCVWLDARKPHNPYTILIYMAEHWYADLSDEFMRKIEDRAASHIFACYLQLIARYPRSVAGFEFSERHVYCQKLRNILDDRPLPSTLQKIWLDAKNYAGRINIEALDVKCPSREDPDYQPEYYYVGDF